jgi:LPS sulfotransferase NodH
MLVITAFQRSGTTALGEQLGALPDFAYWGEVFHPEGYVAAEQSAKLRLRPGANWFRFLEEGLPPEHRIGPQSEGARREAWTAYSRRLETLGSGQRPVIDVKYNSWHNLDPVWAPIVGRPLLMTVLFEQGAGFVHLIRANVLAQALSEVFAHESGVWHRRSAQTVAIDDFRCDADTQGLLARMRESRAETEMMRSWLESMPHVELIYEHTFDEHGDLTAAAREGLAQLGADMPPGAGRPVLGRTGQHPRQWLANADEVVAALTGTEFEPLIDATLGEGQSPE